VSLLVFKGKGSGSSNKADSKTEKTKDKTEEQEPEVDKYNVTFYVVDSTTVSSVDGTTGNAIPSATIDIRDGADSDSGDVIQTVTTGEDGQANVDLESGTYIAQIGTDGYSTMYYTLEVGTEDMMLNCYAAPVNNDNKKTIVLTWDNPDYDLDLTIFTNYQDGGGDMAYIGRGIKSDDDGNYIQSDNSEVCEVAYIDKTGSGNYKIYVNNYTDTQAGNLNSSALGEINAHVYVYADNEQVADYTSVVLWEVAQISGTTYQPCEMVYSDVNGNLWWSGDKTHEYHLKAEKTISQSVYNDNYSYIIYYNYYDIYGNLQSCVTEYYDTYDSFYYDNPDSIYDITYQNTYDSQGRLVSMDDGTIITEYEYDDHGNVTSETRKYKADGSYEDKTCHEYTYNDNGQIEYELIEIWYNDNGQITMFPYAYENYYDEKGRIIVEKYVSRFDIYVYEDGYNLQELVESFDLFDWEFDVAFCNDEGDVVKSEYCNYTDGQINEINGHEYEYEYDAWHNRRSEYVNDDGNRSTTHYSYYEDDYVGDVGISDDELKDVLNCAEWLCDNNEWYVSDLFDNSSKMKYFLGMLEYGNGTRDSITTYGTLEAEYLSYTIDEYNLVLKNLFDMEYDFSQLEHINISNNTNLSKYSTDNVFGDVYYSDGKLVAISGAAGYMGGSGSDIYIYRSGSDVVVQSDMVGDGDFDVYGALKLYLRKNSEGKYYIYKMSENQY
jgi:YD repeat-containing protein